MNLLLDDVATSSPISAIDRAELRPLEEGETKPLATEAAARDRRQHLMVTSVVLCLPETSATLTELDRDPCYCSRRPRTNMVRADATDAPPVGAGGIVAYVKVYIQFSKEAPIALVSFHLEPTTCQSNTKRDAEQGPRKKKKKKLICFNFDRHRYDGAYISSRGD